MNIVKKIEYQMEHLYATGNILTNVDKELCKYNRIMILKYFLELNDKSANDIFLYTKILNLLLSILKRRIEDYDNSKLELTEEEFLKELDYQIIPLEQKEEIKNIILQ